MDLVFDYLGIFVFGYLADKIINLTTDKKELDLSTCLRTMSLDNYFQQPNPAPPVPAPSAQ